MQEVIAAAKSNPAMVTLTREATFFLSKPVMSRLLRRAFQLDSCIKVDPFECTKEAAICLGTIGVYAEAIGGLIAACPETIGAGCIGALLLHPVLGAIVAFQCASAINACGFGTGDKKPCPKTVTDDFGLILQ